MASVETAELVERLWARDPTLWTGHDEAEWLGWLDEPLRMQERAPDLLAFAESASGLADVVLLGMGGSSLAPEVLRRTAAAERFHVLDTTHPAALRRLAEALDLERTLFLVASKSGTTLETRCHLDFFWEAAGGRGERFAAITDPGSELEALARKRGFRATFLGEPTIGGRYSALSVFGLVPAALMGLDVEALLERSAEMLEACRGVGGPGLELGLALGRAWHDGRDKVVVPRAGGFGLWLEQLLAESTGKDGKGLVPAPGESSEGRDRQAHVVHAREPQELGAEFYRWEFATAVAGSLLGVNPFDQPNVQEAKDRTDEALSGTSGSAAAAAGAAAGSLEELLSAAEPGDYVAIQAFVDPAREGEVAPLVSRARETGCVVTLGLGPRYLHSTGQLHKGGPPTGRFIQVYDDWEEDVVIPGREFTFGTLLAAQMVGDFAALEGRGRPIVRVRLEDL